jgi:hypothetical protein
MTTNTSERGLERLIREAAVAGTDPDAAPKMMRYLPFWAAQADGRG